MVPRACGASRSVPDATERAALLSLFREAATHRARGTGEVPMAFQVVTIGVPAVYTTLAKNHTGLAARLHTNAFQQIGLIIGLMIYLCHAIGCVYWFISVVQVGFDAPTLG